MKCALCTSSSTAAFAVVIMSAAIAPQIIVLMWTSCIRSETRWPEYMASSTALVAATTDFRGVSQEQSGWIGRDKTHGVIAGLVPGPPPYPPPASGGG